MYVNQGVSCGRSTTHDHQPSRTAQARERALQPARRQRQRLEPEPRPEPREGGARRGLREVRCQKQKRSPTRPRKPYFLTTPRARPPSFLISHLAKVIKPCIFLSHLVRAFRGLIVSVAQVRAGRDALPLPPHARRREGHVRALSARLPLHGPSQSHGPENSCFPFRRSLWCVFLSWTIELATPLVRV